MNHLWPSAQLLSLGGIMRACSRSYLFLSPVSGAVRLELPDAEWRIAGEDVAMLPPGSFYTLSALDPAAMLCLSFDYRFFLDCLGAEAERICAGGALVFTRDPHRLRADLFGIAVLSLRDPAAERLRLNAMLYAFMDYLKGELPPAPPAAAEPDSGRQRFLRRLQELFSARYMQAFALNDAAEALSYTPQHLATLIKKHSGETFTQLLRHRRVQAAEKLLRFTDLPMAELAAACGFPHTDTLFDSFTAEKGCSPEAYRRDYLDQIAQYSFHRQLLVVRNDRAAIDYLTNLLPLRDQAELRAEPRHLHISLRADAPRAYKRVWRELIHLGGAECFAQAGFSDALKMAQAELHFRYGRVTALPDRSIEYTDGGCDLGAVFEICDLLRSLGMLPWLELSTRDEARLMRLLPSFLAECLRRYGAEQMTRWRFELPARDGGAEAPAAFAQRFSEICRAIRSQVPQVSIGASLGMLLKSSTALSDTLDALRAAHCMPDFYTTELFDTPAETAETPAPPQCAQITEWKRRLRAGKIAAPLYVVRFGAGEPLFGLAADSAYQGSLIIRQMAACMSEAAAMGYCRLLDGGPDGSAASAPLFGGSGLISRDMLLKPSYYAMSFLSKLGPRLLGCGAHHIVAADDEGAFQVLLYSYAYPQDQEPSFSADRDYTRLPISAFVQAEPVDIHLRLESLAAGRYKLRTQSVDMFHGNMLSALIALGRPELLDRADLEHIRQSCAPSLSVEQRQSEGSLEISATLNRGDFRLITITPLM